MLRYSLFLLCLLFLNVSCQNKSEKQENTKIEKSEASATEEKNNTTTSSNTENTETSEPVNNLPSISIKEENNEVEISRLPQNIDEFLEVRDKISTTPKGGATMFIVACMMYVNSSDNDLAPLTVAVAKSRLQKSSKGYKGYIPNPSDLRLIKDQLKRYPFLPNSYVLETSPQEGYSLSDKPLKFSFSTNKYSGSEDEGKIKLFVPSSGADSPRPIKVTRNDKGLWKADEWSSLLVGIRTPPKADNDDL
ncbi:hypothetical protein WAF17_09405 [Bernardetia sp. ABR2-2B]|uniref:DUF6935 domain-containing protein n=1 Tax=Bernardetia sp. ABR2-2B TaxID=3127472 RepID=UPI0030D53BE2